MSAAAGTRRTATTVALAGRWDVVPAGCRAGFAARDKLVAAARGTLPVVDGALAVGADGRLVEAWVRLSVAGVDTGNTRRDHHLVGPGLLDAGRFPTLRAVVVDGVDVAGDVGSAHGVVLAQGVRVPVDLRVTVVRHDGDDLVLHVTGRLDRRPLTLRAPTFLIGRWVDLDVTLAVRRVAHEGGDPVRGTPS